MTEESSLIKTIRKLSDLPSVLTHLHNNRYISNTTKDILERYFCCDSDGLDFECIVDAAEADEVSFSDDVQSFAVCLTFLSTKAYELLTKCWPNGLPSIETVRKWHRRYDGMPGLNESVIATVKEKIGKAKEENVELMFSLHTRSIALNAMLEYDRTSRTVTGHEDFGYVDRRHFDERFEERNLASDAFLFLLSGINLDFHVPIAYFMVPKLDGQQRANVVQEVINFVESNDITVISLTVDGWPHEQSIDMCAHLGADLTNDSSQSHFKSPHGNNIYITFEASCMVTLLRNTLAQKGLIGDGDNQPIRWDVIKKLQKVQHMRGLQCDLTSAHMRFNDKSNDVELAVETMNRKVANAILAMAKHPKCQESFVDVESTATAKYLTAVHDLLDMLHSKCRIETEDDRKFDAMTEALLHIQPYAIKEKIRTNSRAHSGLSQNPALFGLQTSIRSIRGLFNEFVVERKALSSIAPAQFSNQKMDMFITCMKRMGSGDSGECNTAQKIIDSYRRLLLSKCTDKMTRNESGQQVIKCDDVFDVTDNPSTESEFANQ